MKPQIFTLVYHHPLPQLTQFHNVNREAVAKKLRAARSRRRHAVARGAWKDSYFLPDCNVLIYAHRAAD